MKVLLFSIVPRESADGLLRIGELQDYLMNVDFLLRHLPEWARRFGGGDDLARLREEWQREMDALLREAAI